MKTNDVSNRILAIASIPGIEKLTDSDLNELVKILCKNKTSTY